MSFDFDQIKESETWRIGSVRPAALACEVVGGAQPCDPNVDLFTARYGVFMAIIDRKSIQTMIVKIFFFCFNRVCDHNHTCDSTYFDGFFMRMMRFPKKRSENGQNFKHWSIRPNVTISKWNFRFKKPLWNVFLRWIPKQYLKIFLLFSNMTVLYWFKKTSVTLHLSFQHANNALFPKKAI